MDRALGVEAGNIGLPGDVVNRGEQAADALVTENCGYL
jgi:hypothetical protein